MSEGEPAALLTSWDSRAELHAALAPLTSVAFELAVPEGWHTYKPGDLVSISRDPVSREWLHPVKHYAVCGLPTHTYGQDEGMNQGAAGLPICMQRAGFRTEHPGTGACRVHGGATQFAAKPKEPTALERLSVPALRRELTSLAVPLDVDPVDALLQLVREAAGNVAFLGARVAGFGFDLIGDIYSLTRDGEAVATSEDVRGLVKLYNDERDRLARASKLAIEAGLAEREVRVLEDQAALVGQVIRTVVTKLGLDETLQRRALSLLSESFRELSSGTPVSTKNVTPSENDSTIDSTVVDADPDVYVPMTATRRVT